MLADDGFDAVGVDSTHQIFQCATVAGFGIAWLPCWLICEALQEGRLQQVLGEVPGKGFEVHAVWLLTPHLLLKVRLAVDALVSHLPVRMAL